ncbi:hypothetical protein HN018_23735 (plasmid) [Lichenicola cladoniae]|uniref:Uncharacterized protein n=1 Tax=Lichenicola cladoniae TaxID=1484109 RepID=A0A6M8HXX3_9PROT|nr:hypothetical protein [Lichenicola cladoniae]NPD66267.1 hypothetical protein [Acetobacteraceae bacterium]QKE93198.1 hypothetical protein HN018_23735 [Lichenicola cladoniae]
MTQLTPYADDAVSISVGKLTIENGSDRIALYGSLDLSRDQQGLAHAKALKAVLDRVVQTLEAQKDLPQAIPPPETPKVVANPFA